VEGLPAPPASFGVAAIYKTCPAGTRLVRIYNRGSSHPTSWNEFRKFGPTNSRFDHHLEPKREQPRGILYATTGARAVRTALAEVFQETRTIELIRKEPWLAIFDTNRELRLLDVTGDWPVRAGGNMAINSGDRKMSRAWSRVIYSSYPDADGIWSASSLTNQPCVTLYERAAKALPSNPSFNDALTSRKLLAGLTADAAQLNYMISLV
jgi:hypothetical protein